MMESRYLIVMVNFRRVGSIMQCAGLSVGLPPSTLISIVYSSEPELRLSLRSPRL